MLLRTSSNPISPALLSQAIPDSPVKRDLLANAAAAATYSASSSPSTASPRRQIACSKSHLGSARFNRNQGDFRRALSDSNLEDLASPGGLSSIFSSSCSSFAPHILKSQEGSRCSKKLESAPSFGIYHSGDTFDLEELDEEKRSKSAEAKAMSEEEGGELERTLTIGDMIESLDADFSFGKADMGLIKEEEGEGENEDDGFDPSASPPMYLATGLGADFIAGGSNFGMNSEDTDDAEAYYEKMVEEFPSHPLLLRNYAELLKNKGNLEGACEYFFRATLADPEDGEVLAQYARLVWEVQHDQERAGEYFERAAKLSSTDCHVLAAWASFLWETATESAAEAQGHAKPVKSKGGAKSGTSKKEGTSVEEHLRQLVEKNPNNAMFLRNYAQFLYESKKDLKGAEEYYSRAILADPEDGEILIQYANLVWEARKDEETARSYFERAAQAAPADSHVLASYASFLWATEGDEDEQEDGTILVPSVQVPPCMPQVVALRA